MALETATHIDDLVISNPIGTDPANKGDDHLRLIKSVLKTCFPDVDAVVGTIHEGATAPATPSNYKTIWWDTTNSVLKHYNGTSWVRIAPNVTEAQNGSFVWGSTAGGTADALTITLDPAITAYAAGLIIYLIAASNNTATATLNVNGVGDIAIKKNGSANLEADDLVAGRIFALQHDGTNFQLLDDVLSRGVEGQFLMATSGKPGYGVPSMPIEGCLTLESGVPVSTSSQTNKTAIYYTPFKGNKISLYDTTNSVWRIVEFSQVSIADTTVSGTASKPHDIFGYLNSGALAIEMLAWTNDTTRATSLNWKDGELVKTGDDSRLYLGSAYLDSSQQCQQELTGSDSFPKYWIWNMHNRVRRTLVNKVGGTNHTYTTATWRAWNNEPSKHGWDILQGWQDSPTFLFAQGASRNSGSNVNAAVGIGKNSSVTSSADLFGGGFSLSVGNTALQARLWDTANLGRNFYNMVQISQAAGATTWDSVTTNYNQSGLVADILA